MIDYDRDVLAASHRQPVLVDFHAAWCGPCRMLGPVLDTAVRGASGPLKLVAIDTDRHQDLAVRASVSGIPDVRLVIDGRQVAAFTGFRPLPEVQRWLAAHLPATTTPA